MGLSMFIKAVVQDPFELFFAQFEDKDDTLMFSTG